MFWPIVSSTATTLCAFLPMLFWPGVPGEFMGMLPVTLIFVLSASLIVALIYLPVVGGVAGQFSVLLEGRALNLRRRHWLFRAGISLIGSVILYMGLMQLINPNFILGDIANKQNPISIFLMSFCILIGSLFISVGIGSLKIIKVQKRVDSK